MLLLGWLLLAQAASLALPPVAPDVLRVYLVRHGQAYSNLTPKPDLPPAALDRLTDLGRAQAHAAGHGLKGRAVSLLLTSPLGRARETAALVGEVLGLPPRVEPRLRPLDLGLGPRGLPLQWPERIAAFEAGRDPVPQGGESLAGLGERVLGLVRDLAAERRGRSIVLVSHSEVLAAFVGLSQGKQGAASWPPSFRNASVSVVELGAEPLPRVLVQDFAPPQTGGTPVP